MKRFILFMVTMSLVAQNICFAAAPLMHLYIASKYLERHGQRYSSEQKYAFLRGTSFPDIRYLGKLSRTETHEEDISLQKIYATASAFEAGKKFHAWVDEVREHFCTEYQIYETIKKMDPVFLNNGCLLLKLLEDAVLFNNTNNVMLDALILFSSIDPDVKNYNVATKDILRWHGILVVYLSAETNWFLKLANLLFSKIPTGLEEKIPELARNQIIVNYVERLLEIFEKKIKDFAPNH